MLFRSVMHWRRKWQPTLVFLPGESQGQGSLVGPPRLAAPLPLCCTLASARWIFLALPILLPPVRAVLEPAKWLSFKPRAAGGAVAKAHSPPSRPSFDAAAAAWALSHPVTCCHPGSPFFPRAPVRPLQTPPALPRPQALLTRLQSGERQGHSPPLAALTPSPESQSPSPFPWDFPLYFAVPQPHWVCPRSRRV